MRSRYAAASRAVTTGGFKFGMTIARGEVPSRIGQNGFQKRAVTQMHMPIVGAAKGEGRHRPLIAKKSAWGARHGQ